MSSVIKIKRSDTSGSVPSGLEVGEIAVNLFDRKLYVGNTASGVSTIGGEDFRLTSQDAGEGAYVRLIGDQAPSANNVLLRGGTGITVDRDANGSISVTATGNAQAGAGTVGTSALQDGAVTAAKIASNGLTANTYGAKSIGTAAIADAAITSAKIAAGGITSNAIGNDSVALGTKTTGNYVATVADAGAGDIVVSGSGSETAAVTLDLADSISSNTSGTAAQATILETTRTFTITGDVTASAQNFNGSQNVSLTTTLAADSVDGTNIADDSIDSEHIADGAVDAAHLNTNSVSTAKIVDGAVTSDKIADGTIATGDIADAAITSAKIAAKGIQANNIADGIITSAMISAGGVTANAIGSGAVTSAKIGNDAVALGTKTTGNYVATVTGTSNEIEVSGSGSETAAVTIGLPNDVTIGNDLTVTNDLTVSNDATVSGNLTVDGNLTVEGGTTYLSTSTVYTDDGMFKMSANNAGDATDTGIYAKYVVSGNSAVQYAGYFRDATDGVFKFYKGLDVEPAATVDTTDSGYGLAQVDAVIDGGTY